MLLDKDRVAEELARAHFEVEPHLTRIIRILADDEAAAHEPIKLLEVNAATVALGRVMPFAFTATRETPFPSVVAEVTPDEFEKLEQRLLELPRGWSLANSREIPRP